MDSHTAEQKIPNWGKQEASFPPFFPFPRLQEEPMLLATKFANEFNSLSAVWTIVRSLSQTPEVSGNRFRQYHTKTWWEQNRSSLIKL